MTTTIARQRTNSPPSSPSTSANLGRIFGNLRIGDMLPKDDTSPFNVQCADLRRRVQVAFNGQWISPRIGHHVLQQLQGKLSHIETAGDASRHVIF